ncbi:NlpC/P60 family protein [Curtobacterium sp. AG1037]|nr:C40 family peptidase [Curtobacterium sp. AG1037]RDH94802.1 NlpC/P60 family protein [Curtobacterium sp. AG1037]
MGRHALPAAPDGTEPARPQRVATTPETPADLPPTLRRPRGRRSAPSPVAAAVSVQTPAVSALAVSAQAPAVSALGPAVDQARVARTVDAPLPVAAPAVRRLARTAPRPVASTAVAGAVVLSRSAALRAERAADPRHVRRAANAKRAALLLAPALAVTSSLTLTLPANADPMTGADRSATSTSHSDQAAFGHEANQSYTVARDVEVPVVQTDGMTTTTTIVSYPTIVTKYGVTTQQAEDAISKVLSAGGKRATIVSTALQYMGDPYVEGGASHSGIDCSGLTMVAYAAVGIPLVHYVPSQDAVATTIPESEAQPGDLVVFDNEDHVGIYLGDGVVLQAPHPGDPVDIVPVYPNAHHFARLLPAGE